MKRVTLMVISLSLTSGAFAADRPCPGTNGAERTECIEKALKASEGELKRVFSQSIASINSKNYEFIPKLERDKWKATAEHAQSAWTTYRDAECRTVLYSWWGGSGASAAIMECLLVKTQSRIKEL